MNRIWMLAIATLGLAAYLNEVAGTPALNSPMLWLLSGLILGCALTLTFFDWAWAWGSDVEEVLQETGFTSAPTQL